ncbi:MAG: hypothetical protein ACK5P6_06780 [Pseudobdellovibrionaceae bacterium]
MMKQWVLLLIFVPCVSWTQEFSRNVSFEWEPIEGAKTYDLELSSPTESLSFKVTEAQWSGPLKPGSWQMSVRSRDHRGVPGDWSTPESFDVGLEKPKNLKPSQSAQVQSSHSELTEQTFTWDAVPGATTYSFNLQSKKSEFKVEEKLTEPRWTGKIPVADQFEWTVQAHLSPEISSSPSDLSQFTVLGAPLEKPQPTPPKDDWVRDLNWTSVPYAQQYDLAVSRWNPESKKWQLVHKKQDFQQTELVFDPAWPGGQYRLILRAEADLRKASPATEIKFNVRGGDRSPAAQYTETMRESIERTRGWYTIASYLITTMQYLGDYNEAGAVDIKLKAVGGTGRIGAGYLHPDEPWGFLGIIDYSGFTIFGTNHTYGTGELSALHRLETSDRGEIRQQIGLFFREIPEVRADITETYQGTSNVSGLGAHYGAEYWYALSPKLGFQVNGHGYLTFMKISTPNGKAIKPSPSFQVGLLGSYKLSRRATGLVGYAYRYDSLAYESSTGSTNRVEIQGHYLNLFLEYAL